MRGEKWINEQLWELLTRVDGQQGTQFYVLLKKKKIKNDRSWPHVTSYSVTQNVIVSEKTLEYLQDAIGTDTFGNRLIMMVHPKL